MGDQHRGAVAGALTGGFAGAHITGNVANAITRNAMPKPEEILSATSAAYDAIRDANRQIMMPPGTMSIIKQGGLQLLRAQGPAEESAKEVYGVFNGLNTGSGATVADLLNARKNLQQGRLARAVSADNPHDFAGHYLKADVFKHPKKVVMNLRVAVAVTLVAPRAVR